MQPQIKLLLVHRTVSIALAYLNCNAYIMFVVAFTLFGGLTTGCNLFVCIASSQVWLDNTIITTYLITSDGGASMQNEQAAYHQSLLIEMDDCFRHNMYAYILYLRCEDAMFVIQYTCLLITFTLALAGELLNSSILQYDNKCIKVMKRQLQICFTEYICHLTIIYFVQKFLGNIQLFLMHTYDFGQYHVTSLCSFIVII